MKYFVVTSPVEQNVVVSNFGYRRKNVPQLGFTRWDVLKDKKTDDDKFILVMPTWREWLESSSEEDFLASDYYNEYVQLLSDERLLKMTDDYNVKLLLYLHPKFAEHIDSFAEKLSKNIECITFGEKPLNEIMMRCHMLITDYSSVCWDVLFMDKPVIYYQFDYDDYMKTHGAYIDMKHNLPSPRTENREELISLIQEHIENGFHIKEEYEEMLRDFYTYRDSSNCKRTYEFLMSSEEGVEFEEDNTPIEGSAAKS